VKQQSIRWGTVAAMLAGAIPGAAQVASLLKDIAPGASSNLQHEFRALNGTLFFDASDGVHGLELWKSDGTAAGTVMVLDINDGSGFGFGHSSPHELTAWNGVLAFVANDGVRGDELWKSDGSAAGTVLVADLQNGFDVGPSELTPVGSTLYFAASTAGPGVELWKSDGSAAGTELVKDIRSNGSSSPRALAALDGTLYFSARDDLGRHLWRSDGTDDGTFRVTTIGTSGDPQELTAFQGALYFTADDGVHGRELWRSDGTAAGTALVLDIQPGSNPSNPSELVRFDGRLYFTAFTSAGGRELWRTDGTAAGTTQVADVFPGSTSSEANGLTVVGGRLFFAAFAPGLGQELWVSEGTAASTQLVLDIDPGSASGLGVGSFFSYLTDGRGTLYLAADDGVHGTELWRSDGTAAGTVLVQDVRAGSAGALAHQRPYGIALAGPSLYFLADDGVHGLELWTLEPPFQRFRRR